MQTFIADAIRFERQEGGITRAIIETRGEAVADIVIGHAVGVNAAMEFLSLDEPPAAEGGKIVNLHGHRPRR